MRLKGKACLITGAGSGMGRAAAERFAAEGAMVAAFDVRKDAVEETASLIEGFGGKAVAIAGDVCKEADVQAAVRQATKAFGRLDVLYNNAGIFPDEDGSVVDLDEAAYERVLDVNLRGVLLCCKYGVPELIRAGGGSIVNVASFVALLGCTVPQDAYTASKGAVLSLTRSLAVQYGPHHVRANAICPGPIETPLLTEWLLKEPAEKAKRLNRIPMGRFGRPEDIVMLALYLASDESTWTNGAALVADGGITSNYF